MLEQIDLHLLYANTHKFISCFFQFYALYNPYLMTDIETNVALETLFYLFYIFLEIRK